MKAGFAFQEKFVARLKLSVSNNLNLADELADLLNISTDSIYRRLRGQSSFSLDEVMVITEKYGIPMDGLFASDKSHVSFSFNPLYGQTKNYLDYLAWFTQYLTELSLVPGTRITYAADDVPVIRHFNFPNVSAFKAFYWSKAVLNIDLVIAQKYKLDVIPSELIDLNKKAAIAYSKLNCIEIWTSETLTSTLYQVQYFWECNLFESKDDALLVLNDIRQMLNQIGNDCENNDKATREREGDYMLYLSDVMIGNNCVLIEPGNTQYPQRAIIGYNTFNSLSTLDNAFISETKLWMNNLIKKSVLLTGSAEKQRTMFLKKMYGKLEVLEQMIAAS